jgi:H+/Na+-translocating ferredoxin:NAD+ oxidoreductase subunit C
MKITVEHSNKRKLFDFHGGVHPEENKWQSTQEVIQKTSLPPKFVLPLQQHVGAPAKPVVAVGEHVLKGQLLAAADGPVSANLHAPSSGTVEDIADHPIAHPSGLSSKCIVLCPDGKDESVECVTHEDYLNLPPEDARQIIRDAGIAGLGGAGFPTDIKLHPANVKHINTLIINGIECEPYITADDMLMREHADEILRGIEIMARLLDPKQCIIAIEDNKPEACAALTAALNERKQLKSAQARDIELAVVPTKYPSGGEKQLIYILTGEEVPSGGIPADIGVVCQNVGTARAVYRALRYGEAFISRITTLTGEQIKQPCNVEARIGTPINWLIEQYGYTPTQPERLIMGGPMMGFSITDSAMPLVKTTNCILAPSLSELPLNEQAQACIRCGLCTEACPADLLPQQLYWFARSGELEKAEQHNLFDCIECGACAYVCPSSIPLVQYYRHAKGEIKQQRLDHEKSDRARIRFEARQERLERETLEKEAKRKARAEAAAKLQAKKKAEAASTPQETDSAAPPADGKAAAKAAIEAALTRKSTSPTANTQPELSADELKTQLDKAQAKLDKMLDALEDAKQSNPEQISKLQRAVEKNQLRVNQAKQSYERASKFEQESAAEAATTQAGEAQAPPIEIDLDQLELALDKAKSKLETMRTALEDAEQNNTGQQEKLARAVDKNVVRVAAAQKALDDAMKNTQSEKH